MQFFCSTVYILSVSCTLTALTVGDLSRLLDRSVRTGGGGGGCARTPRQLILCNSCGAVAA